VIEIELSSGKFAQVCSTLRQSAISQSWVTLRINDVLYSENTLEYRKAFYEERKKERVWEKLSD